MLLYVAVSCAEEHLRTDNDVSPAVSNGHHTACGEVSDDRAVQLGEKQFVSEIHNVSIGLQYFDAAGWVSGRASSP